MFTILGIIMKKKVAFTLAETLITLVVIGVVSAMTIPNLVIKHQKDQAVIQLKGAYSIFAQAASMARSEYGDFVSWDYTLTNTDFFRTYFYPYVTLSKQTIQDARRDNINYYETSGAIESSLLIMRSQGEIIELINGCQIFTYPLNFSGTGSTYQRKCYAIDINGYKKPNKFGRDLFMLCLDADRGVIPHSWNDNEPSTVKKTRQQLKSSSSYRYNCSKNGRGMWCAALVMKDGWQMRGDYPW